MSSHSHPAQARIDSAGPLRVMVFSSITPSEPWRLMTRLEAEGKSIRVAGLLYEQRAGKSLRQRIHLWKRNFREPGYVTYVTSRLASAFVRPIHQVGTGLLRFAQASRVSYDGRDEMSLPDLATACRERGWAFMLTGDIHASESLEFVRQQHVDLGIVLGTRILKPVLYEIPRLGSINIHKRKVPDYRGGGPVGLWEMLDGQKEIGVTVHRVAEKVDTGAVVGSDVIPIEPYDTVTSLTLKADVLGEDLLLTSVRNIAEGTVIEKAQAGPGKTFKSPKPHELRRYHRRLNASRPACRLLYGRPAWKLALRSILYVGLLPARNWLRRLRKRFPVVILYHHLITDRPHPMGLPTEQFVKHLRYLKRHYRLVSLSEATRILASGVVEEPTAVLTFDDGYADNFLNLRAALRVEPAPVTLFVCPGIIETGEPFPHDVRAGLHGFSPLSTAQLRHFVAEGFEIGSHTRTHFDCGSTDERQLESEIEGSRRDLQALLGCAPSFFSFPWGALKNMSDAAVRKAAEHFEWYCSAYGGENWPGSAERHLKRKPYPLNLWELELALQGILDLSPPRRPLHQLPQLHKGSKPASPSTSGPLSNGASAP